MSKKTTERATSKSGARRARPPKDVAPRKRPASKKRRADARPGRTAVWVREADLAYKKELRFLQVELLKLQNHVKNEGLRVVALFEGRDAAGKGGAIKRITEHLNPRGARVVALEKPSDREQTQWYFQRYVAHLPAAGEIVLFDRSWYNRAMVEPVMGFCTDEQNKRFLKDVPLFERMLVKDGIKLFKYYFSVSKEEQLRRFKARHKHALKQHKISPVDLQAQGLWDQYTVKKFQTLGESNRTIAPWTIIRADKKKPARIQCIRHLLGSMDYPGRPTPGRLRTDPEIVISGIDELKFLEDNLLGDKPLPG
jgi:polyphosphate kinase 2